MGKQTCTKESSLRLKIGTTPSKINSQSTFNVFNKKHGQLVILAQSVGSNSMSHLYHINACKGTIYGGENRLLEIQHHDTPKQLMKALKIEKIFRSYVVLKTNETYKMRNVKTNFFQSVHKYV